MLGRKSAGDVEHASLPGRPHQRKEVFEGQVLLLMREEERHGRALDQRTRHAAEYELTQARMAVSAHDDEIGVDRARLIDQSVFCGAA